MPFFVNWIRDGEINRFAHPHASLEGALDFACEAFRIECSDVWVSDEHGRRVVDWAVIHSYAVKKEFPSVMPISAEVASKTHSVIQWDAFISHASEDKESFVSPLAALLSSHGLSIWFDRTELTVGDSLRRSIDEGLAHSRFGIVVLSPAFMRKEWPQRELDGLFAREDDGAKVILPVWHKITKSQITDRSPLLASRLGVSSDAGLEHVANELLRAIRRDTKVVLSKNPTLKAEILALGPNIVCVGEILSVEQAEWKIRLDEFVVSEIGNLIRYAENFEQTKPIDRYVILNAIGDGRVLTAAPSLTKDGKSYIVRCPVAGSAPRTAAKDLPSDLAISPTTNDLYLESGNIARVSGVASLPQKLRQCLSHIKGESMFARDYGSRLQELYWRYHNTSWLVPMLKLDIIRQAAIPYPDITMKQQHTPLRCVERVWAVELLSEQPEEDRVQIRLDLEIKGLGRKEYEVSVLMPSVEKLKIANA